jgi:hypothetical protein
VRQSIHYLCSIAIVLWASVSLAQVPLPSDVAIAPPAPDLRADLAAFSGKWVGKWSGRLDAILIVEHIDTDKANVIYAWGDAPQWGIEKGYKRFVASVIATDGAALDFQSGSGSFHVQMNNDLATVKVTRVAFSRTDIESFRRTGP